MKTQAKLSWSWQVPIVIAYPEMGPRVVHSVKSWISASGLSWTVERLKALRTAAMQIKAGHPEIARAIYQKASIAYFRDTLYPRGPYGPVVRDYVEGRKPQVVRRADLVLRLYTAFVLKEPRAEDVEKARRSITGPFTGSASALRHWSRVMFRWGEKLKAYLPPLEEPSLARLQPFTSTYASARAPTERRRDGSGWTILPYGKHVASLMSEGAWPEEVARERTMRLSQDGKSDYVRQLRAILYEEGLLEINHSGKITSILAGGTKVRWVATPTAYAQWLFEPLHRALVRVTEKAFPESCSLEDTHGVQWAYNQFCAGNPLWCFDLSSATDRFPRILQTSLLRGMGLEAYASGLEQMCKSWAAPNGEVWDYAVGQPMGLYSSFPLFHLTHLCLLAELDMIAGIQRLKETRVFEAPAGGGNYRFVVKGDDVAISDEYLAKDYDFTMRSLGVDISDTKTFASSSLAEFAGFVVVTTSRGAHAYTPYKYGTQDGDAYHAPVRLIHSVGRRLGARSPYWAERVRRFERSRAFRDFALNPLIPVTDDDGAGYPAILDRYRLANLMTSVASDSITLTTYGSWWDEEDVLAAAAIGAETQDTASLAENAAGQLLNQQCSAGHRELLSTPKGAVGGTPSKTEMSRRMAGQLKADPLMRDRLPPFVEATLSKATPLPDEAADVAAAFRDLYDRKEY